MGHIQLIMAVSGLPESISQNAEFQQVFTEYVIAVLHEARANV